MSMYDDPARGVRRSARSARRAVDDAADYVADAVDDATDEFEDLDDEFDEGGYRGRGTRGLFGTLGNAANQVLRLQFGLVSVPVNLLPRRARRHARTALDETYLTFKVLIEDVSDALDNGLGGTDTRRRSRSRSVLVEDADDIPPADPVMPTTGTL